MNDLKLSTVVWQNAVTGEKRVLKGHLLCEDCYDKVVGVESVNAAGEKTFKEARIFNMMDRPVLFKGSTCSKCGKVKSCALLAETNESAFSA